MSSTPVRRVEPEWLDSMRPDDPRAIRSRRDLQRLNSWILQGGIMSKLLLSNCSNSPPRSMLDLGAGDGTFMLQVAQRLAPHWPNVTVILLDRQSIVSAETRRAFRTLGWRAEAVGADVFEYLERAAVPAVDAITANLFLHHFQHQQLERLLSLAMRRTRLLIACEPRRSKVALTGSRLLWAIGCNDVTCHDARVSVRAGFNGRELSTLWSEREGWDLQEHRAKLFTHCLVARRLGAAGK
jgi:hypothetical protein